jgi:hypothetical protein
MFFSRERIRISDCGQLKDSAEKYGQQDPTGENAYVCGEGNTVYVVLQTDAAERDVVVVCDGL